MRVYGRSGLDEPRKQGRMARITAWRGNCSLGVGQQGLSGNEAGRETPKRLACQHCITPKRHESACIKHTRQKNFCFAEKVGVCTDALQPAKKKKLSSKYEAFFLVRDLILRVPSPFSCAAQLVVLYIATTDAPDTQNRLERTEQGPSGYTSPPSARSFSSVICLGRGELLRDRCCASTIVCSFFGSVSQL